MLRRTRIQDSTVRTRQKTGNDAQFRRGASGFEVNMSSRRRPRRSPGGRLRTRRLLWLIACCLAIVLSGEIVYAIFNSYRFALKEITISGVAPAAIPLVKQQLPQAPGPSIFVLRTGRIAQRVQALPFVEEVRIRRRPFHTLAVEVRERRAAAFSRQKWGTAYLDNRGLVFTRPGEIPDGLAEVTGISFSRRNILKTITGLHGQALRKAIAGFARRPNMKLRALGIDRNGWMIATLTSGIQLKLGNENQLEMKLLQAAAILEDLTKQKKQIEYIDVAAWDEKMRSGIVWKPAEDQDTKDGSSQ